MKSHAEGNTPEAAPAPQPETAAAPEPASAPTPTLEQRVAKLESYIPRIEALLGAP